MFIFWDMKCTFGTDFASADSRICSQVNSRLWRQQELHFHLPACFFSINVHIRHLCVYSTSCTATSVSKCTTKSFAASLPNTQSPGDKKHVTSSKGFKTVLNHRRVYRSALMYSPSMISLLLCRLRPTHKHTRMQSHIICHQEDNDSLRGSLVSLSCNRNDLMTAQL